MSFVVYVNADLFSDCFAGDIGRSVSQSHTLFGSCSLLCFVLLHSPKTVGTLDSPAFTLGWRLVLHLFADLIHRQGFSDLSILSILMLCMVVRYPPGTASPHRPPQDVWEFGTYQGIVQFSTIDNFFLVAVLVPHHNNP